MERQIIEKSNDIEKSMNKEVEYRKEKRERERERERERDREREREREETARTHAAYTYTESTKPNLETSKENVYMHSCHRQDSTYHCV